ncbi:DUF58 domain-containing protein [Acidobacteria bacterium AH-259-D05]|nr:DUF58 domain-containing protein [Acidobacteria bacterium AH-259-D05]
MSKLANLKLQSPEEPLERLQLIEIYTRKRILAHILGEYESPRKGAGFEFREHKRYQPGDDYRRIDWNVTSRFHYPYVKQFVAEKEVNVWLVTDLSSSMFFGSAGRSKSEIMTDVVAVLGFSASHLNMKVGFLGFSDQVESLLAPKQRRAVTWDILRLIPRSRSTRRTTHFGGVVETLQRQMKVTSMIFLLSDFISLEQIFETAGVRHLARHHDLVPVVIEDPLERSVPHIPGVHCTQDPESGRRRMSYWSRENVREYRREMKRRQERLSRLFYRMDLDFLWIDAGDENFVDRLVEFFIRRGRLS